MTVPAMRTWPAAASSAAMTRVRQKRACQSHLSRRSPDSLAETSLKLSSSAEFEIAERGKGRIAGLCRLLLFAATIPRPALLLLRPGVEAQLAILFNRAEAKSGDHGRQCCHIA